MSELFSSSLPVTWADFNGESSSSGNLKAPDIK